MDVVKLFGEFSIRLNFERIIFRCPESITLLKIVIIAQLLFAIPLSDVENYSFVSSHA